MRFVLLPACFAVVSGLGPSVCKTLKKRGPGLTVSVEYEPANVQTKSDIALLSMQLRKSKVATIWTPSVDAVANFIDEQQTAKGDFPGPCPVIFNGASDDAEAAVAAGAAAVVLDAAQAESAPALDAEVLWRVGSADELEKVKAAGGKADEGAGGWADGVGFVIAGEADDAGSVLKALPSGAVAVASFEAMQPEGAEIAAGRQLASEYKCKALLMTGACVGDNEDLEYAQYAQYTLTSKASTEFKIDGMTGSVNGHFGMRKAQRVGGWDRQAARSS